MSEAPKPTKEELAYLIKDWNPDDKQIADALLQNVADGKLVISGFKDGEPMFQLTEYGKKQAEILYKKARQYLAMIKGLQ